MPTKDCLFDDKYFLFQWDEDQPEIIIPDEVKDDVDNDWVIPQDQKEHAIEEYLTGQTEAENAMYGDPPGGAPKGKKWAWVWLPYDRDRKSVV